MSDAGAREMSDRELREYNAFFEEIIKGVGPLNAAIGLGWSPAKLRRLQQDPEFVEMMAIAKERRLEGHEETLDRMAAAGHFKALQMILYNERSERWKDVRHIQSSHSEQLDVGVVVSVKQSVLELLREQGVDALQPQAIEVESREPVADS